MKWTYNQLGLMPPLTWSEWGLMLCVSCLLFVAGWVLFKFIRVAFDMLRGMNAKNKRVIRLHRGRPG
jgi:hypothetical protein